MFVKTPNKNQTHHKTNPFSRNNIAFIQPKLKVGKPGDKYEVEADKMADQVVNKETRSNTVQKKEGEEEVQQKSLASNISTLVQMKDAFEEEPIQKAEEQEESVQAKEEEEPIQKLEEEDTVQNKEDEEVQAKSNETTTASSLQGKLRKGSGGSKMDTQTQNQMESGFGADFSRVNIHTDNDAAQMNQGIGAQAFTHGNDVYFNQGKYDPRSKEGKHLLAHELTHTIQQRGVIQKNESSSSLSKTTNNIQGGFFGSLWNGIKSIGSSIGSGISSIANYGLNVLKSAGAWVWDAITETPIRIWRILKHIKSGIVDNLLWMWNGIFGALGHIWKAVKGIFNWVKDGIVGFFSWIWRGLQGGANWAWKLLKGDFSGFWEGIGESFLWIGDGLVGLVKWGWEGLKAAIIWAGEGVVGIAKWIGRGILSGAVWALRLVAKLFDLASFGEILDLIFQIVKFNTRTLTAVEEKEARKVFGNSLSYWQIRIDEYSLISAIGAFFNGGGGMGVTLFHTINFNKKISAAPGNGDMAWLIHELTHVSQYENVGSQYIGEAIHSQATTGYGYGGGAALAGKNLSDFNREQQGDIIKHYYSQVLYGSTPYSSDYTRMKKQLELGKL